MSATTYAATDADQADAIAAPLDLLLTSAANGPLRRFAPNRSWSRAASALSLRPQVVARRVAHLTGELGQVVLGTSDRAPSTRDKRFADPAWTANPMLRRSVQAHLALTETAQNLVDDAELEWRDRERLDFLVENLMDALAPSNNPFVSPLAWKALVDTGGGNILSGVRHALSDLSKAPRVPSMVAPDAFAVGRTLALTPGAVVHRTEVFELIQYTPTTPTVGATPLLLVPPVINKFYVTDIAPGRSMIEYFVASGIQVFAISWRNPDATARSWGTDTYGRSILGALDVTRRITRSAKAHVFAICSGGLLTAMTLGHLADIGRLDHVASLGLAVAVIDNREAGQVVALADEQTARAAVVRSRLKGYLDGRALAEVFAWLRPNDLIWSYWVNNYLQGRKPAPFDVLFWNADTTRMPAQLHSDFVDIALTNSVAQPGGATMLDSPVNLAKVDVPAYVVAGVADHISPWQACYRTTQLLGGPTRFVLSSSGHIASMVNPPGNPKSSFQTAQENPADPESWRAGSTAEQGSWWPDYVSWLAANGTGDKKAPTRLGGGGYSPIDAAPGTYVLDA
ncbi:PHA/PHB synthase family protein [Monashia sp. NPDC004114]